MSHLNNDGLRHNKTKHKINHAHIHAVPNYMLLENEMSVTDT